MRNKELIHFRKLVRSILPGHFFSKDIAPFGLEFQGFRQYEPGENPETVDWSASSMTWPREKLMRLGERKRNVLVAFIYDATRSMASKRKLVVNLWTALYEASCEAGHQIGCFTLANGPVESIRPNIGVFNAGEAARKIEKIVCGGQETRLSSAFDFLLKRYGAFSQVAVVVSDLLFEADYRDALRRYRRRGNEAVFIIPRDGAEEDVNLPLWASLSARDSESGQLSCVSSSAKAGRVLSGHVSLLEESGAGWAVLNEEGARARGLEKNLAQAFRYQSGLKKSKERKERRK